MTDSDHRTEQRGELVAWFRDNPSYLPVLLSVLVLASFAVAYGKIKRWVSRHV